MPKFRDHKPKPPPDSIFLTRLQQLARGGEIGSPLSQKSRARAFNWLYRVKAPTSDYQPASALGIDGEDAAVVNRFCYDLSRHYREMILFYGRQKPSPHSLKKELWATGSKAEATIVPKLEQLTDLHRLLGTITPEAEDMLSAITQLEERGRRVSEAELIILDGLEAAGLPPDTFRRLIELREQIEERVKDGSWDKSYKEWRRRWILTLAAAYEIVVGEPPKNIDWPEGEYPVGGTEVFDDFCITAALPDPEFEVHILSMATARSRIRTVLREYKLPSDLE